MDRYSIKRRPEYYSQVLAVHDVNDLRRYVIDHFDPINVDDSVDDVLRMVLIDTYAMLVSDIGCMTDEEVVDWANVVLQAREDRILSADGYVASVALPETFSEN